MSKAIPTLQIILGIIGVLLSLWLFIGDAAASWNASDFLLVLFSIFIILHGIYGMKE